MKRFSPGSIGVAQGSCVMFSDFADGGEMWTGEGGRESRHAVAFSQVFRQAPAVHVCISMWDMDHQANARADLTAENIGTAGFDLVFKTWGNTRVARIRADWMAIGQLSDDDDWEID